MRTYKIDKNIILILLSSVFLVLLIISPKEAIHSVLEGINLWYSNVMPSLLPFMIVSSILFQLDVVFILRKVFNRVMDILFNISGSGVLAMIMGFLSGYPLGSKIVCDLRKEEDITIEESYKLLALCSTTGPAFTISVISIKMFDNLKIVPILLFSNYLGAILNALLVKRIYREKLSPNAYQKNEVKSFSNILNTSIVYSIQNVVKIGGYIVFFNILVHYLDFTNITQFVVNFFVKYNLFNVSEELIKGIFYGLFEITLGINTISKCIDPLSIKVAVTAFITAWSGLSIHMQTNSFLIETDIRYSRFLLGKITQSILSTIVCVISFKAFYPSTLSVYKNDNYINVIERFNDATFTLHSLIAFTCLTIVLLLYQREKTNIRK